nr:EOG090X00JH [Triops cancriformis]
MKKISGVTIDACGLPLYWKVPLFLAAGGEKLGYLTADVFLEFWQKVLRLYHDEASRFMFILNSTHSSKEKHESSSNYLLPDHFIPLLQDVVESHPGLTFLKAASEFHSRYIHTVVARIFYCVNRSWSGRVTLTELRHSNLLDIIRILEEEEDINQITDYFSYEHFYVIYCKFWELDRDHDLFIDRKDLARHNEHALSSRIIDRIFSGAVTRGGPHRQGTLKQGRSLDRMSYTEFVWFLIAEEDKRHPTAVEYWFRCMDLDGDGYLSMYELEYFYEEQLQRMETLGIESLPFEDCLCQMLDMVNPAIPGKISLKDLRQCRLCPVFFDTFFNLDKFLDHEQRDPFACQTDPNQQVSDWDRYAAEEYELLVAEESGSDQVDDIYCQEDGDADMTEDSFGDEHAYPVERRVPLSSRQATY